MDRRKYLASLTGLSISSVASSIIRAESRISIDYDSSSILASSKVDSNYIVSTISKLSIKASNIENTSDPIELSILVNTDTDSLGYTELQSYDVYLDNNTEVVDVGSISVNLGDDPEGRDYKNANTVKLGIRVNHTDTSTSFSSTVIVDSIFGIVDNFEDGDGLSPYKLLLEGQEFSIGSTQVYDGDKSLTIGHNSGNPRMMSSSGLNSYPEIGDKIIWNFYLTDQYNAGVILGFFNQSDTSREDRYSVSIGRRESGSDGRLTEVYNGKVNRKSKNFSLSNNTWYECEIQTNENEISVIVYNVDKSTRTRTKKVAEIIMTNPQLSKGSLILGMTANTSASSTSSYIDNVRTR